MSAYVVAPNHINGLISWARSRVIGGALTYYWQGRRRDIRGDEARCASVLYAENVRSVSSRYNDAEPAHGFAFRPTFCEVNPVQIIKACHCYAYQACESDEWETSEARAIVDAIEAAAIRALPGYDAAAWGMPEDPRKLRTA